MDGAHNPAQALVQEAAELWRQFGDERRLAYALNFVARPLFLKGALFVPARSGLKRWH